MATPASLFVDKPFVLGSTRLITFDVTTTDVNGIKTAADLSGDRIEIIIKALEEDEDDEAVKKFTSEAAEITLSTTVTGRFTWQIPHTFHPPLGTLKYRLWRIINFDAGPPTEDRQHLLTEDFVVEP